MAAFFMIVNHVSYFLLSHPDVSIKNPAYMIKHKQINDNNPRTRLIAFLIVWIRESSCCSSVPITPTQGTAIMSQNFHHAVAVNTIGQDRANTDKLVMINL